MNMYFIEITYVEGSTKRHEFSEKRIPEFNARYEMLCEDAREPEESGVSSVTTNLPAHRGDV